MLAWGTNSSQPNRSRIYVVYKAHRRDRSNGEMSRDKDTAKPLATKEYMYTLRQLNKVMMISQF